MVMLDLFITVVQYFVFALAKLNCNGYLHIPGCVHQCHVTEEPKP